MNLLIHLEKEVLLDFLTTRAIHVVILRNGIYIFIYNLLLIVDYFLCIINIRTVKGEICVGVFAGDKPIKSGTELTIDYDWESVDKNNR